jgi:hypothetical protein
MEQAINEEQAVGY